MPYATNDGVRIHYEVEGSGPPLFLHIGFLGSLDDWCRADVRYAEALRDTYRLLLLDPRGQGRSDPGLTDAVPIIRTPTLVYFGTKDFPDRLPEPSATRMPDATVVTLEGLDHAQAFRRSDRGRPTSGHSWSASPLRPARVTPHERCLKAGKRRGRPPGRPRPPLPSQPVEPVGATHPFPDLDHSGRQPAECRVGVSSSVVRQARPGEAS
jgi:hypothetical protein